MKSRFAVIVGVLFIGLTLLAPRCPQQDEKVRIIAFGDSLTYGWSIISSYPQVLERMMELPPGTILNAGLAGELLAYSEVRLEEVLDYGYPNLRVILFWEGGNDLLIDIMTNNPDLALPADPANPIFESMEGHGRRRIEMILDRGYELVVGTYYHFVPGKVPCYIIPEGMSPEQAANLATYVDLGNRAILDLAEGYGLRVARMDELGMLEGDPDNYIDCLHADIDGHALIAAKWFEVAGDLDLGLSEEDDDPIEGDDNDSDVLCGR